jgi:hypothetical protein
VFTVHLAGVAISDLCHADGPYTAFAKVNWRAGPIGLYYSRLCAASGSFGVAKATHGERYDQPLACASFSVSSSFLVLPPPRPLSVALFQIRSSRLGMR